MREISAVRQDSERGVRRWFQDDYFDLFVWQDASGEPVAFQLCYARGGNEGAIEWHAQRGFSHGRIDPGARPARHAMSPLLRPDGVPPYYRIVNRFLDLPPDWDPQLHAFVLERLREYRQALFGTRRPPRRPRSARR